MQHDSLGVAPGGLAELTDRGALVRHVSANGADVDRRIRPYSAVIIPKLDRVVTTTTDMDGKDGIPAVQLWRLSDLQLLKTFDLPQGPRGDEAGLTAEPRLLGDGKTVLVSTFDCGLYLLSGLDGRSPGGQLVSSFPRKKDTYCAIPVIAGHFYLVTVPAWNAVVSLDISNPAKPREVSRVVLGEQDVPHWIAIEPNHRRVVITGYGALKHRVMLANFDEVTGRLTLDERFREDGATDAGMRMDNKSWPHGGSYPGIPHGAVFSLPPNAVAGAQNPSFPTSIPFDSGMTDRRFPPTFEAIRLPTHGTTVNAVLYGAQGPQLHPALVFLHGFPGNERNLDLVHALRRAGFVGLFFNYRGSWGSGGAFSFAGARADIGAATSYLRQPEVARRLRIDTNRIYLVGHSMGGWLALAGAADDPTIHCTVALAPWNLGRVGALLGDASADSRRFVTSFKTNTDPISGPLRTAPDALIREVIAAKDDWDFTALAPRLANRATLVVTSTHDEASPEFQRAGLDAAMKKLGAARYTSLTLDDDHPFSAHRLGIAKLVENWLQKICEP
jgi:pimeloyl-ACP methyl ester carboxylesterase